MSADGSEQRSVFSPPLGRGSWAPYYHPDGKRIIFRWKLDVVLLQKKIWDKILFQLEFQLNRRGVRSLHSQWGWQRSRSGCYSTFYLCGILFTNSHTIKVTSGGHFNSYPMFSHNGQKLVWASSRGASNPRGLNIFIADWVSLMQLDVHTISGVGESAKAQQLALHSFDGF